MGCFGGGGTQLCVVQQQSFDLCGITILGFCGVLELSKVTHLGTFEQVENSLIIYNAILNSFRYQKNFDTNLSEIHILLTLDFGEIMLVFSFGLGL